MISLKEILCYIPVFVPWSVFDKNINFSLSFILSLIRINDPYKVERRDGETG
jgi:hypothetical protein